MNKNGVIVIPARWNSKRLPGKPLAKIAGRTMLERVYRKGMEAINGMDGMDVVVATDDARIEAHCKEIGAKVVMTPESCLTGSDRVLSAVNELGYEPEIVLNLQGDTPLMPVDFVRKVIAALKEDRNIDVATPVLQLSWQELDKLRESKKTTPFTGTTVTLDANGNCLWFSKVIIPGMRKETSLREELEWSPVHQHVGLYGYRYEALKRFVNLKEGIYEKLEGLEQLRMLENGMCIRGVKVKHIDGASTRGVDSPEDIKRVEAALEAMA